jgi:type IV pilus assembly protein PilY1
VGYWSGRIGRSTVNLYLGNYLNWRVIYGTSYEKKITVAKRVLTKLVTNTENVRFGLMTFTNSGQIGQGGGKIVAPIGSSVATITTAINGISPSGYTPLGEMLRDAGKYYKGQGDYNGNYTTSPIQLECQANYVILMTDGLQNGSVDVRTEATNRHTQDHASLLPGTQTVSVSTIGFAVASGESAAANDVLQTAADNGGGKFWSTESEADLETALEDLVTEITQGTYAFASPVLPPTKVTGTNRIYLASFLSNPQNPFWQGSLQAYNRNSDGTIPVDPTTGVPLDSAFAWGAGQLLRDRAAADRVIYTMVSGSRVEFTTSTTAITAAMLGFTGGTASTDRDKLINFIRGVDSYSTTNPTAERPWKLGDIFHSTPVLVTPPLSPTPVTDDGTYAAFKLANAGRTSVLLTGANDGMLHAFRESDGVELWGFIPPDLLGNLKLLTASGTSGHPPFFVDGSPVAADVKIGSDWKTIVIFGERRGGKYYHALDITNPSNPAYLWGFHHADLAETWSNPIIGRIKMADGSTKFVVFFGGGYDTAVNNDTGKAVFAVDAATGSLLWEYKNVGGATDDRQYMNFSIPADVTAVDINPIDGYIDGLYVGDVGGQVWKFDLSAPATLSGGQVSNWLGKRLFQADSTELNPPLHGEYYATQAIYSRVIPAFDSRNALWIYFGTGDRNHPSNTTAPNRFYGIKDNTTMGNGSPLTEANLVDVTSADHSVDQGFYIRLTGKDSAAPSGSLPTEKVLAGADVFNRIVYFTSFIPTSTSSCGAGGTGRLFAIQMVTGYAALDFHSGAALTTTDSSVTRSEEIGQGIPTSPVVDITDSGASVSTEVVIGESDSTISRNPIPPPSSMRKVLLWREVF